MARVSMPLEGRRRVLIENVTPSVDGGRFPAKRIVGDVLVVEADVFADGHDELTVALKVQPAPGADGAAQDIELAMAPLGNDRWRATINLEKVGRYKFTVVAMIDEYATWQHDFEKRVAAGHDVKVDKLIGEGILARRKKQQQDPEAPDPWTYGPRLEVVVDRPLAQFSLHELNYGPNNRPDWVSIPLRGLLELLGAPVAPDA